MAIVGKLTPLLLVVVLGPVLASACASGQAQVIEDRPTLAVPPVPPRTIEPPPAIAPPTVEPTVEPVPPPATTPKPRPAPRTTEPKPESKPETPPDTIIASVPPNPAPVAPLRSAATPSGPDAVRQIRDVLQRTEAILSRVDYQKLSEDRRTTYDGAKNFIKQAEEKINQQDLTLARSFADRAENIAKTLLDSGR